MELTCQVRGRRGFTLTEIAIVLGIIGLILGAIWTAAARVYSNQRVGKASQEVLAIAAAAHSAFASKGVVTTGPAWINDFAVSTGIFSQDMVRNTASPQGFSSKNSVWSPWNGEVALGSQTGWNGMTGATNKFEIVYMNVPTADCPAFMGAVVQQGVSAGLVQAGNQGTSINVTNTTSITDPLILACTNIVSFEFQL